MDCWAADEGQNVSRAGAAAWWAPRRRWWLETGSESAIPTAVEDLFDPTRVEVLVEDSPMRAQSQPIAILWLIDQDPESALAAFLTNAQR